MPCLVSQMLLPPTLSEEGEEGGKVYLPAEGKSALQRKMSDAYCTPEWLGVQLERGFQGSGPDDLKILDCRTSNDFNISHILGAVPLALPAILLRRLRNGKVSIEQILKRSETEGTHLEDQWTDKTLVLYDEASSPMDNTSQSPTTSSTVSLLLNKLREEGYTAYLLSGGFTSFQTTHSHLCIGPTGSTPSEDAEQEPYTLGLTNLKISSAGSEDERRGATESDGSAPFPVEVIPSLFLGNRQVAEEQETLQKHDIRYIVNVTTDIPNHFEDNPNFHYLQIPITDNIKENLASFFPKANAFIDEARSEKAGVLVHCLAGISRSVTVTVAYLMYAMQLSFNEAFSLVKRKKTNISPNFNFLGQLLDYQERLQCSCRSSCVNAITTVSSSVSGAESSPPTDCSCSCHERKCFFTSPTVTTCTSTSSTCTSSSLEFEYDVPPTPS